MRITDEQLSWTEPEVVNGVRQEATGWRDGNLSARHRMYGPGLSMVDIDCLVHEMPAIEYMGAGQPRAMIDYKSARSRIKLDDPGMRAQSWLANCGRIPFLIARYIKFPWEYHVIAGNLHARRLLGGPGAGGQDVVTRYMSERDFVALLYQLRGRTVSERELLPFDAQCLPERLGPAW